MTIVLCSAAAAGVLFLVWAKFRRGRWLPRRLTAMTWWPLDKSRHAIGIMARGFHAKSRGAGDRQVGSDTSDVLAAAVPTQPFRVVSLARSFTASDSGFANRRSGEIQEVGHPLGPPPVTMTRHLGRVTEVAAPRATDDEVKAVMWVSSIGGQFRPQAVDLPPSRTRVIAGREGTEVPLPGVTAKVTLVRSGSRWYASVDEADVAYLGGVPLRNVSIPVPSGVPLTVQGVQLNITYQKLDSRWALAGSRETGAGVAVVNDPSRPGLADLSAAVMGMCFDPWEPRAGLASVVRAGAALQALGMELPHEFAMVGLREDGHVEVVASGRIRLWAMENGSPRRLCDQNLDTPTRAHLLERSHDRLVVALGTGQKDEDVEARLRIRLSAVSEDPAVIIHDDLTWLLLNRLDSSHAA